MTALISLWCEKNEVTDFTGQRRWVKQTYGFETILVKQFYTWQECPYRKICTAIWNLCLFGGLPGKTSVVSLCIVYLHTNRFTFSFGTVILLDNIEFWLSLYCRQCFMYEHQNWWYTETKDCSFVYDLT
jgi:hypothetical protein